MPRTARQRPPQAGVGISTQRFARLGLTVFLVLLLGTGGVLVLDALVGLGTSTGAGEHLPWWRRAGPFASSGPRDVLVAWTSGGLPDGFARQVGSLEQVTATSVVSGDLVDLSGSWDAEGTPVDQPPQGLAFPLDVLAIDPSSHAAVFGEAWDEAAPHLEAGQALLSRSSADFRGLGRGAVVELGGGRRLTVAGVVADVLVGSAELVVPASQGQALGVSTKRSVLVRYTGERASLEAAVRETAGSEPVEIASPGEVEAFRHAGSVLPQITVKERFGEFAYRHGGDGRGVVVEQAWVDRHIVQAQMPILGEVDCHQRLTPQLRGALVAIKDAGLAHRINPSGYAGCYAARLIGEDAGLSRHTWGIAVDVNAHRNPYGAEPSLDPRIVGIFERWGFTWGGGWLVPDGMHFEYVGRPTGR